MEESLSEFSVMGVQRAVWNGGEEMADKSEYCYRAKNMCVLKTLGRGHGTPGGIIDRECHYAIVLQLLILLSQPLQGLGLQAYTSTSYMISTGICLLEMSLTKEKSRWNGGGWR